MRWLAGIVIVLLADGAVSDIRQTPHSLARAGAMKDAMEVCVFCHTPSLNLPDGEARRIVPAWQHALAGDHIFAMFDDIGRAQYADKPAVGSQSIACLSCHDSNQAFSVTNYSFDHPFGIPYRGFSRYRHIPQQDAERDRGAPAVAARHLKSVDDFREPSSAIVDNRVVWWVSSSGNPVLRSRSDLPLYARLDSASGSEVPYVECSSCHDPHTTNPSFLRVSQQGSRLCLTCHDK